MNDQTHLGPKTQFTIYTEDLDREAIIALVTQEFSAATLHSGVGLWHGKAESSLAITILGHESSRGAVHSVAQNIKRHNQQEAVRVMEVKLESVIFV